MQTTEANVGGSRGWLSQDGTQAASWVVVGAVLGIAAAEALGAIYGPTIAAVLAALMLLGLLNAHLVLGDRPEGPALAVLSVVPLLRLISLTATAPQIPALWWHVEISSPVLVAGYFISRYSGVPFRGADRKTVTPKLLGAAAGAGVLVGAVGFSLVHPARLARTPIGMLAGALLLVPFGAVAEEFLFRGLIQTALGRQLGRGGIPLTAVVAAGTYAGSGSMVYVAMMAVVSLALSWLAERAGTVWYGVAARGGLVISLLVVCPWL